MRVLQVNKYYSPDIGGVETVVKQYADEIGKFFPVTVLCVHKKFCIRTKIDFIDGIKVIRCSSLGTFFSMPISVSFYYKFYKLARKNNVVHFHEPFPLASVLSIILNKKSKYIVTWHSDIIKQKLFRTIAKHFQTLLCRKATVITTTSPSLLKYSKVISKFPKKVVILPLGIETDRSTFEIKDNDYILYLGRLSYYKGIEILLKAYEKAKTKMNLLIVGDGDTEIVESIRTAQESTKKNIEFINKFVTDKGKQEIISECSFLVFPSIEPSEAFGIIQLEAMDLYKPVINTNLPTGVPFVSVHNLTGITVSPGDVDELADAIDTLSADLDLRRHFGLSAHHRVKAEFSNRILMDKLISIYKNL